VLRVTVELWPGGREGPKRVIATADIARIRDGEQADYQVRLAEDLLGGIGEFATVTAYPRWSATVWDLVARCIAASLNRGREELPPRPVTPKVPVHTSLSGTRYVRIREIPEPTRTFFARNLSRSSRPEVLDDPFPTDCAYAHDWQDFLLGRR
jgi:hypothetical protein